MWKLKEFLGNIVKFLKSVLGPKASDSVYKKRLDTCFSCTWNITKGDSNYCRECGCPKTKLWPFSELKRKCRYKNANCPRQKWIE